VSLTKIKPLSEDNSKYRVNISLKLPVNLYAVTNTLVKEGIFKTRTEVIETALERFLFELFLVSNVLFTKSSDQLNDPEKMKDLVSNPEFVKSWELLKRTTFQNFLEDFLKVSKRARPNELQRLVSLLQSQHKEKVINNE